VANLYCLPYFKILNSILLFFFPGRPYNHLAGNIFFFPRRPRTPYRRPAIYIFFSSPCTQPRTQWGYFFFFFLSLFSFSPNQPRAAGQFFLLFFFSFPLFSFSHPARSRPFSPPYIHLSSPHFFPPYLKTRDKNRGSKTRHFRQGHLSTLYQNKIQFPLHIHTYTKIDML
jgi:hypothetical protein